MENNRRRGPLTYPGVAMQRIHGFLQAPAFFAHQAKYIMFVL
jgi:hypothetical protein